MTRSKYNAIPTIVDGVRFASRAEAKRYGELKLLVLAGDITRLELQPAFKCFVNGVLICTYRGDFRYFTAAACVVEDVKGMKTPVYKLKKRLVEACYPGTKIVEISK